MRAMMHLLKFEVRRLAPALLLLAVFMLSWLGFLWKMGSPVAEIDSAVATAVCAVAVGALAILIAALAVWIGLGHPSRRTDSFWRTRPVDIAALVCAKLAVLLGAMIFVGLARCLAVAAWGVSWTGALSMLWLPVIVFAVPALMLLLLATWAGSWRKLFVVIGIAVVGLVCLGQLLWLFDFPKEVLDSLLVAVERTAYLRFGEDGKGEFLQQPNYSWMRVQVLVALGAALILALWTEFRTRSTRWWVSAVALGMLLAGFAALMVPTYGTKEQMRELAWSREVTDELIGVLEPVDDAERTMIGNGKEAERVTLRLNTPWWDGEGTIYFVGSSISDFWFSGEDAEGVERKIPVELEYSSLGEIVRVGDFNAARESLLEPLLLVKTDQKPVYADNVTFGEGGFLQEERLLVTDELRKRGVTKGRIGGTVFAWQSVPLKTADISLARPSKVQLGETVFRIGKAAVASVPKFEDKGFPLMVDVVQVKAVMVGLRKWQRSGDGVIRASLLPAFDDSGSYLGDPSLAWGDLLLVHPDGVHAIHADMQMTGAVSAFGWTRVALHVDVPMTGVEGVDGSPDFPTIDESEALGMRLIWEGTERRKVIRVTIPATPWKLVQP